AATFASERVRLFVESREPAMLVLLDRWYPGWWATVNGDEVPIFRANGAFRAVQVPEGVSEVEFRFAPRSLRLGGILSALGLAGFVLMLALSRRRMRIR
ncbi:MAG: YfhO family protein, partial [Gemmatimonadota bacterium]|nr:YfhO family protein [Gemmatimonadota bacterium]